MFKGSFFKIAYAIVLLLLIIFLAGQVPYVMKPLSTVLSLILLPLLLGGFLYYLLRPLVRCFVSKLKNKNISILITVLLVIIFSILVIYFGGSIIYSESKELIKYYSLHQEAIKENINQISNLGNGKLDFLDDFKIQKRMVTFIQGVLEKLSNYNFMGAFSSLKHFGMIIILIPFVVFYLLKDDEKIYQLVISFFSGERKEGLEKILAEIDQVLSAYIGSQLIVAFILGILMFIGYISIALPNPLALALIAMITSLIPILGPSMGILPALFIAITTSPLMIIKLFIVLAIAQYLEGNLIRPLVQGEKLNIHPLIVLFVVLISIFMFGILGALFAVPTYAVIRVIIKNRSYLKRSNR
ncbi:AI-2E family transporter [Orenia marismortui]|uniref:AI-2E family transporter n=1 Tax=Orenia marismortui TaxID=46469 RepID=UPI00037E28F3|nr:AI-2E family transporter [Orenia marismortui]